MEQFLNGKVTLHRGDCLEVLPTLDEGSVDAVVTDPPYGLSFMGRHWDHGVPGVDFWKATLRLLKPGGHLLAFGGDRTYHRLACAIEDAGFDIRHTIVYCFGSGFPKSHDISKAIDRLAGAEREVVEHGKPVKRIIPGADQNKHGWEKNNGREYVPNTTVPATDAAAQWQGWGTSLKPAVELICLARKPITESSIAANVLKHGTGAINVDGCRVGVDASDDIHAKNPHTKGGFGHAGASIYGTSEGAQPYDPAQGRWPANLIHDGSEEVLEGFPDNAEGKDNFKHSAISIYGSPGKANEYNGESKSSWGSAARFFYTAKADVDDRLGSKHPTVKPIDLMQYLVRLITPKGGIVLDPFAGTGTCAEAAYYEGMRAILIEREPEYQADIVKRMGLVLSGPDSRRGASIKQESLDDTPLFGRLER